jgi:hypothetical protein
LTIKSDAPPPIESSIALKNGSSRGPKIKCAATPLGGLIAARFVRAGGVSAR